MSLVTLEEVRAALGLSDASQDAQVSALIPSVSGEVEAYANCVLAARAGIVERHYGGAAEIFLDARPVSAVGAVRDLVSGEVLDASEYLLDGPLGVLYREPHGETWTGAYRVSSLTPFRTTRAAGSHRRWEVTYDAGYATAEVPGDVKAACFATMAARLRGQGGLASEKEGDYAYALQGGAGLPPEARAALASYRSSPV